MASFNFINAFSHFLCAVLAELYSWSVAMSVSITGYTQHDGMLIFRIAAVHQRSSAIGNWTASDGDAFYTFLHRQSSLFSRSYVSHHECAVLLLGFSEFKIKNVTVHEERF